MLIGSWHSVGSFILCVFTISSLSLFEVVCERWQNTWSNLLEEGVLGRRDGL